METSLKNIGIRSACLLLLLGFALIAAGCESTPRSAVGIEPQEEAPEGHPEYLGPTPEQLASEKIFPITVTDPHVFEAPGLGRLVTVGTNTVVRPAKMADLSNQPWLTQPIATAAFERQSKTYQVFVYELREGESLVEWSKRSTTGDASFPDETVQTRNEKRGYVYTTNDLGAIPDVHVTIATERYVYIFQDFEEQGERPWRVPADFLNFIREVEVQ